jgi:hypothetical protein
MTSVEELVSRYVAVWNEPDPSRRRQAIAALWTEDGAHFTPSLEARGYEAIEARIRGAHERFVRTEGYVFSAAHQGAGHHDAVTFSWEMRPAGGGPVAARGFHFFVLGGDGRIRSDYQFAEPSPPA